MKGDEEQVKKRLLLFVILEIILLFPIMVYAYSYPYPKVLDGPSHISIIYEDNGGVEMPLNVESVCSVGDKIYFLTYNALYRMELDGSDIDIVFAFHSSDEHIELNNEELEMVEKYPSLWYIVSNREGLLFGYDGYSWYEITDNGDGYCTKIPYKECIFDDVLRYSKTTFVENMLDTMDTSHKPTLPVDLPPDIDTYVFDDEHQVLYYLKDSFLYCKQDKGQDKCIRHIPVITENNTPMHLLYVNDSTVVVYNELYIMLLDPQEEIMLKNRLSVEFDYYHYLYPAICAIQNPELQVMLTLESDNADIMIGSTLYDKCCNTCLLIPMCDSILTSLSGYDPVIRGLISIPEGVYALPLNLYCSLWRVELSSATADYLNNFSTYNDVFLYAKERSQYSSTDYFQTGFLYSQAHMLLSDYIYQSIVQGIYPNKYCIETLCQIVQAQKSEKTPSTTACIKPIYKMCEFTDLNCELFNFQAPFPINESCIPQINAWIDYMYINPITQNRDVAIEYMKSAFAYQNKEIKFLLNPYTKQSPDTDVDINNYRKLLDAEIFVLKTGDCFGWDEYMLHERSMYILSLEQMLLMDTTGLLSNHAEETYRKLFSQFVFTRTEEIGPGIMENMSWYIDQFLIGEMTASEMYTNLFWNQENENH